MLSHVTLFRDRLLDFRSVWGLTGYSLHPRSTRTSWWSPPVIQGETVILLGICFVWHSRTVTEQGGTPSAWTIAERSGCPVVRLTSSLCLLNWSDKFFNSPTPPETRLKIVIMSKLVVLKKLGPQWNFTPPYITTDLNLPSLELWIVDIVFILSLCSWIPRRLSCSQCLSLMYWCLSVHERL